MEVRCLLSYLVDDSQQILPEVLPLLVLPQILLEVLPLLVLPQILPEALPLLALPEFLLESPPESLLLVDIF